MSAKKSKNHSQNIPLQFNKDVISDNSQKNEKSINNKINYSEIDHTDTSDEEELRNHVGNIPHEWYDDFEHFGYTIEGNKLKKKSFTNDSSLYNINEFLNAYDNKDYWKTITDKSTGMKYVLDDDDVNILNNIQVGKYPDPTFNPYQEYVDWFSGDIQLMPINCVPESKRSFMPLFSEHRQIMRLVKAIRNGHIKLNKKDDDNNSVIGQSKLTTDNYYLLWDTSNDDIHNNLSKVMRWRRNMHWAAPKLPLPDTSESFNPPQEYLPDEDEVKKWNETEYEKKIGKVLPQKYDCLRHVPTYANFVKEKFERCLDLYLCPRKKKSKVMIDPESLIPKLPSLNELQPFPSWEALKFIGHSCQVTSLSINFDGDLMASGDTDGNVIIWSTFTTRQLFALKLSIDCPISTVQWNKNPKLNKILLVTCDNKTIILLPIINSSSVTYDNVRDSLLLLNNNDETPIHNTSMNNDYSDKLEWSKFVKYQLDNSNIIYYMMTITQQNIKVTSSDWHRAGDYILNVVNNLSNNRYSIIIHQWSKKRSQCPFKKTKPFIQRALFHPLKPIVFVATQKKIFVYNLQKQIHIKTYSTCVHWISSIAIHSLGDNFVIGSYDKRISWYDTDYAITPYKTMKYNKKAIRDIDIHNNLPLCCAASDDGSCTLLHTRVYNDFSKDTLIVPIKQLRGNGLVEGFSTCKFHPFKPWLFAAAIDGSIRLFM